MSRTFIAEFLRGPWRLRVILARDADIRIGNDRQVIDAYIWFVGRDIEDEWFTHGIAESFSTADVLEMVRAIDGEIMDIMLTYAGTPWAEVEALGPEAVTKLQFAIQTGLLNNPKMLEDLKTMGRSEILAIRAAEENQYDSRFK